MELLRRLSLLFSSESEGRSNVCIGSGSILTVLWSCVVNSPTDKSSSSRIGLGSLWKTERKIYLILVNSVVILKGNLFVCRLFPTKSVENLKSFRRIALKSTLF